jgi:hypothetical protein
MGFVVYTLAIVTVVLLLPDHDNPIHEEASQVTAITALLEPRI